MTLKNQPEPREDKMSAQQELKSIQKIPDFSVDDTVRRFACWLQRRCREKPGFEAAIADITFASTSTVQSWKYGQRPSMEALLRALAYGGPRAVDEVLLDPMGMSGARWPGDPLVERLFVAVRELDAALAGLSIHPDTPACEVSLDRCREVIDRANKIIGELTDLRRARTVVELRDRAAQR